MTLVTLFSCIMPLSYASSCLKFAVLPRKTKAGRLECKRLLSNFRGSMLSSCDGEKDEEPLRKSMETDQKLKRSVVKGNGVNSNTANIQSIQDDPGKVENMTVQELRTILRSVGVPAKGLKRDLVSTLKNYLEGKVDDTDDRCTFTEESVSPEHSNFIDNVSSLKRKANTKNLPDRNNAHDINTTVEVSAIRRSKRAVRQSAVKDKTIKVSKETASMKQRLSIDSVEVSDHTEPWTIFAHKKPQEGWIAYNPRTMRPPAPADDTKCLKLMSWNVNGLRALLKLEGFSALQLAKRENFDVLCLQETKLQEKDVEAIKQCLIEGYDNSFWTCSVSKLGYSGTAILSRIKPISVRYGLGISDHDTEGRLVTAEFDSFYLLSGYVPNSGDGLKRLPYRITEWDPSLSNYMKELEKLKPVILTGDLNCAHQEIDIYNPAGNKRSAGFTEEERKSFETNFLSRGFVDTFRKQHPGVVGYTYWGYRHGGRKTNKGWRLDYFLVSESIADKVHDSYILPDVTGSDHSPIGLILKL